MRRLILLPVVALALSGCAGGGDGGGDDDIATAGGATPSASTADDGGGGDADEDGRKFAQCMRENGLPWYEDPEPGQRGVRIRIPRGQDKSTVDKAMAACRRHLPNGGEPPRMDPEALERARQMAKCMRANGVPDFPDPGPNGEIRINGGEMSVGPGDPAFDAAEKACARYLPDGGPRRQRSGA